MNKQYITSIHYLRAISMLGVLAIHIGSFAFYNPTPSVTLTLVFEILSRYSVPAFFFLSAFGMFHTQPLTTPFSYPAFLKKRLKTVLYPYIGWTFIYLAYATLVTHDLTPWHPWNLLITLFYGLGCYHIYFMVILLWFYLLMPLWRYFLPILLKAPLLSYTLLFLTNVFLNYYSSYETWHAPFPWLQSLWDYRLNYSTIHYLFIFLFGALTAHHYPAFQRHLKNHAKTYLTLTLISAILMAAAYYYTLFYKHYTPLEAVYTIHQLSPVGMLYTPLFILGTMALFETYTIPKKLHTLLTKLADHSYLIYLSHPLILMVTAPLYTALHYTYTAPQLIILYLCTLLFTYAFSLLLTNLPLPKPLRTFLMGK